MSVRDSASFLYPNGSTIGYFDVDKSSEWSTCTAACLDHPLCVSFVPFNATCRLASRTPIMRRGARRRPLAVLSASCRVNATSSPTHRPTSPTLSPTSLITESPTPLTTRPTPLTTRPTPLTTRPTSPPTSNEYEDDIDEAEWISPSGIRRSVPYHADLFYSPRIEPCEYIRSRMGRRKISNKPWTGTREECYKDCEYDPECDGAAFGENECIKFDVLEITDDAAGAKRWWSNRWTAVAKKTAAVGYYSALCAGYDQYAPCDTDPRCAWNAGKQGWNQIRIIQSTWCGRIVCESPK